MSAHQENIIPISPLSHTFHSSVENEQMLNMPMRQPSMISVPTAFDILLGKDSFIYNHDGNRKFRSIIYDHTNEYLAAPSKRCKSKIVQDVQKYLQKSGYRFLRKINDGRELGFIEIKCREARQKISHALRDGARERQRKMPSNPIITMDRPPASFSKNNNEKNRRSPSKLTKRKIDIDLTTRETRMSIQDCDRRASHAVGCSGERLKFQPRKYDKLPRRVSLQEDESTIYEKEQQDLPGHVAPKGKYDFIFDHALLPERRNQQFQPRKYDKLTRRVSLEEDESTIHEKKQQDLPGHVASKGKYAFIFDHSLLPERRNQQFPPHTIEDEEFQDYEPLNPSIENGFAYSRNPRFLAKRVKDLNVDHFLSVVRSL